jgi:predicted Ser/Thr protein kinase
VTPERKREIDRIYQSALERPVAERAGFLAKACHGDDDLRGQVESLLTLQRQAGSFLETPAMMVAARELAVLLAEGHATATIQTPMPRGESLETGDRLAQHGPLDDARFAPGQIFASRYRVVSLLGRGAMGEVYRVEDLKLGQPVALKLVAGSAARRGDRVQRLMSEVRLARTITHPNVCRVYDIGEADGWWYISMELVDGETLASLLRRIGRLPAEKALDMARQFCAGLAAAHDRGILHRDLKPSNIMVDGRGQIRILDFGLAVASGEWTIGEIAGTPAYMAPEQLAGGRVTERTDLYALGLVLYETYSGRSLFPVHTIEERRHVSDHASAAHSLPGIEPEIERIIQSCLKRDPGERPASAAAIAALLPGGDPLAAALAKGVVPSPEMVAAAGPKGALRPAQAWALLGAILVGTLAIATQAHVVNVAPSDVPKLPEVLAERARSILAEVEAAPVEADRAFWFAFDASLASPSGASPSAETTVSGAKRTKVTFVYRQSPRFLVPTNPFHLVTDADPPADVPGMATLTLDPLGRLISFTRVVPQRATGATTSAPTVNWPVLFREAGLDEREFVAAEPDHAPRVPHDNRLAWNRTSAASGPFHVTAATLDGNAVQFDAASNGVPADAPRGYMSTGRSPAGEAALWAVTALIFAGGTVLARHNLRLGQGDRRGARRLGIFIVSVGVLGAILRAHHVPIAVEELAFLYGVAGYAMVGGGLTWLTWLSLEPFLRREWPRTLISWTRLLSGRVRDPLVGRDVLIGMLVGIVQMTIVIARFHISKRAAPADILLTALESLKSVPHFANRALASQLVNAVIYALSGAFLLFVIRLVVRKTWITVLVGVLVGIPFVPGGSSVPFGWELVGVMVAPLLTATLFLRVGLLAQCAMMFTDLLVRVPLTLDTDAWYFGNSLVVLLILAVLAIYGFVVSLGGRPAFGGRPA